MQLELITDVKQLRGTFYYELLPDLYKGKHRSSNSVFIQGDTFDLLEPAFTGSVPSFDPYGPTTISGRKIEDLARKLEDLAKSVKAARSSAEVTEWGSFHPSVSQDRTDWQVARPQIACLLEDLGGWLRAVRAKDRPVSILGL